MIKLSLEDLVSEAQAGDTQALNSLLSEIRPLVFRQCMVQCDQHRANAEDVTQLALIRISEALKGFEGRSNIKTWVNRVTTSVFLNYVSKEARKKKNWKSWEGMYSDKFNVEDAHHFTDNNSPEDEMAVIDVELALAKAYSRMSAEHLTCLNLSCGGATMKDMSIMLGIEISSVKTRLSRARSIVNQYLLNACETQLPYARK